jgi:hypothetical protein
MTQKLSASRRIAVLVVGAATGLALILGTTDYYRAKGDQRAVVQLPDDDSADGTPPQTTGGSEEVSKHLHAGETVGNVEKDAILADLEGDGRKEMIIFYTIPAAHQANILVLKPEGND